MAYIPTWCGAWLETGLITLPQTVVFIHLHRLSILSTWSFAETLMKIYFLKIMLSFPLKLITQNIRFC
jgi:hypothetical protein